MIFNSFNILIVRISQGAKRSGFKRGTQPYHIIDNVYNKLESGTFSALIDIGPNVSAPCDQKVLVFTKPQLSQKCLVVRIYP